VLLWIPKYLLLETRQRQPPGRCSLCFHPDPPLFFTQAGSPSLVTIFSYTLKKSPSVPETLRLSLLLPFSLLVLPATSLSIYFRIARTFTSRQRSSCMLGEFPPFYLCSSPFFLLLEPPSPYSPWAGFLFCPLADLSGAEAI